MEHQFEVSDEIGVDSHDEVGVTNVLADHVQVGRVPQQVRQSRGKLYSPHTRSHCSGAALWWVSLSTCSSGVTDHVQVQVGRVT